MLCSALALPRLFHFLIYLLYFLLQLFRSCFLFFFPSLPLHFFFTTSSHILKRCLLLQPVGDYLSFIFVHFFSIFCDCPFSNSVLPHRSPFISLPFSLLLQTAHLFLSVPLSSLLLSLLLVSILKFFCFFILPLQTLSPIP